MIAGFETVSMSFFFTLATWTLLRSGLGHADRPICTCRFCLDSAMRHGSKLDGLRAAEGADAACLWLLPDRSR